MPVFIISAQPTHPNEFMKMYIASVYGMYITSFVVILFQLMVHGLCGLLGLSVLSVVMVVYVREHVTVLIRQHYMVV